jgi:glc operon protein GlcG
MQTLITLGHAEAQRAIDVMKAELDLRAKGAVLAVADAHGELIALLRMDGARLSSVPIAMNKAFTAAREQAPTREVGARARDPGKGFPMTNYGDLRYVGWGGGLPVLVEGRVVGAVGVSGLPETEDEEIAEVGRRAILERAES